MKFYFSFFQKSQAYLFKLKCLERLVPYIQKYTLKHERQYILFKKILPSQVCNNKNYFIFFYSFHIYSKSSYKKLLYRNRYAILYTKYYFIFSMKQSLLYPNRVCNGVFGLKYGNLFSEVFLILYKKK